VQFTLCFLGTRLWAFPRGREFSNEEVSDIAWNSDSSVFEVFGGFSENCVQVWTIFIWAEVTLIACHYL